MSKGIKRLIFDIEVSPCVGFFWKPSYKVSLSHDNIIHEGAIMCICWKWEHAKKVHHVEWEKGDDRRCIEEFLPVAEEADELIAHNGDKFDVQWINTRALKHDLGPVPIWKTVDTLSIARRRFRFNSNRLDYLGKFLFGAGKIHTSFDMWKDIVLKNCSKSMKDMVKYCKQDVLLLEKVWHALQPYHTSKTHVGVLMGNEKWSCPDTGSENVVKQKTRISASGMVQHQMQSNETGKYYTISNKAFEEYCAWRAGA